MARPLPEPLPLLCNAAIAAERQHQIIFVIELFDDFHVEIVLGAQVIHLNGPRRRVEKLE